MKTLIAFCTAALATIATAQDLVVFGDTIHTAVGEAITDGVIVIRDGKIAAVGTRGSVTVPQGLEQRRAAVVTPGLIDGRSTAGLTGIFNSPREDQDMLETSGPMQPELRALDSYNSREALVGYLRGLGITTIHTGYAPGEVISGQTFVVKTREANVSEIVLKSPAAVVATISPSALKGGGQSPGTRGKLVAMLREQLFKAQERMRTIEEAEADEEKDAPAPDLRLDTLISVLNREIPLIVTANKAQDIDSALRLADEFGFELWLDSGAEAYLEAERLAEKGVPVIVHPPMARAWGGGELVNMSLTTPATLADAGVTIALQSGYEGYVPKVRVVLFEAAIAAAYGLGFDRALQAITITPARMLGVDDRVGSIEVGKDGDLALFDGDPFEYTTHCVGTIIEGRVVSDQPQ